MTAFHRITSDEFIVAKSVDTVPIGRYPGLTLTMINISYIEA